MKENVEYKPLTSQYDSALAEVIQMNLEAAAFISHQQCRRNHSGDGKVRCMPAGI